MKKKYSIAICCGANIATSTIVTNRVKEWLTNEGIRAEFIKCKINELPNYKPDIVISTTPVPDPGCPVFNGVPFVTNTNTGPVKQQILDCLKAMED
ncbi:MAG: PTS sugar transporter subunit IIB [Chloroflexi bacterium]|nr:PTS sugar transporter subunit IIB [Chloroflexota bacterium]